MAKRQARRVDDDRTKLLGLDELFVLKGRGDQNFFFTWQHEHEVETCPLCSGGAIKIQDRFAKTYFDLIHDAHGCPRVIQLTYEFFKYRCLNESCHHIFAKEVHFASKNDNITYRLENAISRMVMKGDSYSRIQAQLQEKLSRQAIGQIFHRWLKKKEAARIIRRTPTSLAILSGRIGEESYTLFLNLDDRIRVFDILLGVKSTDIRAMLQRLGPNTITTVLSDCDPVINDTITDFRLPALHIIPVELWLRNAIEDYSVFAHETIRWCTVPRKDELILIPRSRLVYNDEYVLGKILEARPNIKPAYDDYSRLCRLIERRGELWVFEELLEWAESACEDIQRCMAPSMYLLQTYRNEIEAQTQNRDAVPDRLGDYAFQLEGLLSQAKTYSEDVLRARVLYSTDANLDDWRGVPIEDVISKLRDMNIATSRKRRVLNEYQ